MKYKPLSCELYDFIEVICMRHSSVELEAVDGTRIRATALSTKTTASKEEYLQVESPGLIHEVRLDRISAITVYNPGSTGQRQEFIGKESRFSCEIYQDNE